MRWLSTKAMDALIWLMSRKGAIRRDPPRLTHRHAPRCCCLDVNVPDLTCTACPHHGPKATDQFNADAKAREDIARALRARKERT